MSIKHFFSNVQQQVQQTSDRSVPEGRAVSSASPLIGSRLVSNGRQRWRRSIAASLETLWGQTASVMTLEFV